jgi:CheY-like chemotaxis protein
MLRRMLESRTNNAEVLGRELLVEEADDGLTVLEALKSATGCHKLNNHVGKRNKDAGKESDLEEGDPKQKGFDLVFIDYIMTTMNGPEAVQIMRKELKFTGGIIGVTGNDFPADLTYFKECGADLAWSSPSHSRTRS